MEKGDIKVVMINFLIIFFNDFLNLSCDIILNIITSFSLIGSVLKIDCIVPQKVTLISN